MSHSNYREVYKKPKILMPTVSTVLLLSNELLPEGTKYASTINAQRYLFFEFLSIWQKSK